MGGSLQRRGDAPLPGGGALRGRYAPSPSGELHLGNLRTALAAWLGARSSGGSFVMRVEDLEPAQIVPGAEGRILADLRWLGMDWDEGPEEGGPHAPYRQSERGPIFREALRHLQEAGLLFACECSRADLKRLASAPHGPEGPPYPGTCRHKGLPIDLESEIPLSGRKGAALRFRVPEGVIRFVDAVQGPQEEELPRSVGDFVVRRADGLFAYQLAVVVDDARMGIQEVVRGDDLLGSTARQIALFRALGCREPAFAHVPLVLDREGRRLAKRDGATAIAALREGGMGAERLTGILGHSLGLLEKPEPCRPRDLLPLFAWENVPRSP